MSYSYTVSGTTTFTVTHARQLAAKVATDLKRMQRFYGAPSDQRIDAYELELIELLKGRYFERATYGFKRNDRWIAPTLRYTANDLSDSLADDDPGRVQPGADTSDGAFYSFLAYSYQWRELSASAKEEVESRIPLNRADALESDIDGYLENDRTYSAGGRNLVRSSVRSY